jgi:hypothetical protein
MKRVLNGGLNRDISSRILKATTNSDPLEVAHVIAGPEPLRSGLRAASRKNIDRQLISEAGAAVRRFDLLIRSEAGTRRPLDAIISASLPNARERFELASKQAIFKGMSQLKGVQAKTWLSSTLIHPLADDPARHDLALLHGALSMQRLRPGVTVRFTYRELVVPDDDEGEPSEEEAPLLGSLKVDQFFINPPARLEAHQAGKVMNYTLAEDCLGPRSVADMPVVDHHPAALDRYVSPGPGLRPCSRRMLTTVDRDTLQMPSFLSFPSIRAQPHSSPSRCGPRAGGCPLWSGRLHRARGSHGTPRAPSYLWPCRRLKSAYAFRSSRVLLRYERLPTRVISGLRRRHMLPHTLPRMRGME